ncbi:Protein of unknown function [Monaibacterium marinum]|uniref:DUF3429 domain-containing protein n=1 Tax=Pontivivens marinum TaxID=1690039 RepID=A0A2C9CXA7_9RHOB|nr:DUF3429 domain-containing protein [Monaibacterium marinum]SOH95069.1 Protein of unknown function [Monaibacterium marinum]
MSNIPRPALVISMIGLIPFIVGALAILAPDTLPQIGWFDGGVSAGRALLSLYGTMILCFLAGSLWGFASRHGRKPGWIELGLAIAPVLALLFAMSNDPSRSCAVLVYAFAGLLLIECWYARRAIVVWWWLSLRIPLTIVVSLCLMIGAFA